MSLCLVDWGGGKSRPQGIPENVLTLSRKVDELKPLPRAHAGDGRRQLRRPRRLHRAGQRVRGGPICRGAAMSGSGASYNSFNRPISVYRLGGMPIQSCGQSVSAPHGKAGARLIAHTSCVHGEASARRGTQYTEIGMLLKPSAVNPVSTWGQVTCTALPRAVLVLKRDDIPQVGALHPAPAGQVARQPGAYTRPLVSST